MSEESEHPQLKFNPLILMAIAILITFLTQWVFPLPFFYPTLGSGIGAVLFIGGFVLGFPALNAMMQVKTSPNPNHAPTNLVLGGTYRLTRNPMYLGMVVSYIGLFIFSHNLWFIPFTPILVWLVTIWVIIPEEQFLEKKFGDQYVLFKSQVHRWI